MHLYPTLEALGFDDRYRQALAELDEPHLVPARVAAAIGGRLSLLTEDGPRSAHAASHRCVVGDWLAITPNEPSTVHAMLPRRTDLSRQAAGRKTERQVMAANVDCVWVVTALNRDFNPRRVERYLMAVAAGGAEAVVVLNKIDLDPDGIDRASRELERCAPGCRVVLTSALYEDGLDDLLASIQPGQTAVLVGSSGVGKSTLTNRLLGTEQMAVSEARADDDRGRHTTTHRELHSLPEGRGVLIDTPGIRELQLWDAEGLDKVFPELAELATRCRYRNCAHEGEDGCAIEQAVADGSIDADRVTSWHKLKGEAARQHKRHDDWQARKNRRSRTKTNKKTQRSGPRKFR